MSADLSERAREAVAMAEAAGAGDAWVSLSKNRDVEFEYRDGRLEKVKDATSQVLTLRVYADGRFSTHSTTDLDPARLGGFVRDAVAITRALEPDEHRAITPEDLFPAAPGADLDLVDPTVVALEREQRAEWCRALEAAARDHARVISVTAGVYDGSGRTVSASSNGFLGEHRSTYCWFGSEVTLRDRGDKRASDWFYAGGAHVADLPDAAGVGREALSRALVRLDADKGPTRRATMVVDGRAAGSLVDRLLRPANARSVQQGQSFWAGTVGSQIFSPVLGIVDDPLIPRGLASRHFDAEGIAAASLPLVEAGTVRNLYVDTYYGRKGGMAPTTGEPSNRRVLTGTHSFEELLAAVGNGLYVTSWLGGNADSTTGDFSLGLRGHLIEQGEIGAPVGEMNVTGNLVDLFARLELAGNDVYPYATTLSPTLVFADVDFSGA